MIDSQAVALVPIRHLIQSITIDRTSEAARCRPTWGVSALLQDLEFMSLGFGQRMRRSGPSALWWLSDPTLPDSLIQAAEEEALPALRAVDDLQAYLSFAIREGFARVKWSPRYVKYLMALGELDKARDTLKADVRADKYWAPVLDSIGVREALMHDGDRLATKHRAAIAELLHEREARSVANLKLEKFWERTPFPLELG
jgi:hypothetical protein